MVLVGVCIYGSCGFVWICMVYGDGREGVEECVWLVYMILGVEGKKWRGVCVCVCMCVLGRMYLVGVCG